MPNIHQAFLAEFLTKNVKKNPLCTLYEKQTNNTTIHFICSEVMRADRYMLSTSIELDLLLAAGQYLGVSTSFLGSVEHLQG